LNSLVSVNGPWVNDLENPFNPCLHNGHLSDLVSFISEENHTAVVLDKTGFTESIDIDLMGDISNTNNLASQLKAHGIRLYQSEEDVVMLVIGDK
jgi:hypothetical protein